MCFLSTTHNIGKNIANRQKLIEKPTKTHRKTDKNS